MKQFIRLLVSFLLVAGSVQIYAECDHDSFHSYKADTNIGFYTNLVEGESDLCSAIEIDHVVSLHEATERGLADNQCRKFANDKENHVAACASINRSKQNLGPEGFFRRSCDGIGKEYGIINWEEYLHIYYKILHKYGLLKTGMRKQFASRPNCFEQE